jgi:hypothetical protein
MEQAGGKEWLLTTLHMNGASLDGFVLACNIFLHPQTSVLLCRRGDADYKNLLLVLLLSPDPSTIRRHLPTPSTFVMSRKSNRPQKPLGHARSIVTLG